MAGKEAVTKLTKLRQQSELATPFAPRFGLHAGADHQPKRKKVDGTGETVANLALRFCGFWGFGLGLAMGMGRGNWGMGGRPLAWEGPVRCVTVAGRREGRIVVGRMGWSLVFGWWW